MRLAVMLLAGILALPGTANATDPVTGLVRSFFHYQAPSPPVGGNCAAISAEIGAASTWYGEFSGKRLGINDRYGAYAARGCFDSEFACRVWQQQAITYAFGPIGYTSCRSGVSGRYAR